MCEEYPTDDTGNRGDPPSPDDGHRWEGRLDYPVLSPCFVCGAPLASHVANQIKDDVG